MKLREAFECVRTCSCCVGVGAGIITLMVLFFGIDHYLPSPTTDIKIKEAPPITNGHDGTGVVNFSISTSKDEDVWSVGDINGLNKRPGKYPLT